VNDGETFDIVFDKDDETRRNVPLNELQIQNVSVVDSFPFYLCKQAEWSHSSFSFSHNSLTSYIFLIFPIFSIFSFSFFIGDIRI
jgi:hypothetical protein